MKLHEWTVDRPADVIDLTLAGALLGLVERYGGARYTALDYRRDSGRLGRLEDLEPGVQLSEPRRPLTDEARQALTEAVRTLSKADQVILALLDAEGLPTQVAAAHLGISHDAVRQRHSRARRRLAAVARDDVRLLNFLERGST